MPSSLEMSSNTQQIASSSSGKSKDSNSSSNSKSMKRKKESSSSSSSDTAAAAAASSTTANAKKNSSSSSSSSSSSNNNSSTTTTQSQQQLFSMSKLRKATAKQRQQVLQKLNKRPVAELKRFEKEQGVSVLFDWLQDYHKSKNYTNIVLLFRVLKRIPISINTLKRTQIGKFCNNLVKEEKLPSEVHSIILQVINKWKDNVTRVSSRMAAAPIPKKSSQPRPPAKEKSPEKESEENDATSTTTTTDSIGNRKRSREEMEHRAGSIGTGSSNQHAAEASHSMGQPPAKKKKVKKSVSWAPPSKLEEIKVFEVDREAIRRAFDPFAPPIDGEGPSTDSLTPQQLASVSSEVEWHKPTQLAGVKMRESEKIHFSYTGMAPEPTEPNEESYDDSKTPIIAWEFNEEDLKSLSSTLIDDILNTVDDGNKQQNTSTPQPVYQQQQQQQYASYGQPQQQQQYWSYGQQQQQPAQGGYQQWGAPQPAQQYPQYTGYTQPQQQFNSWGSTYR